MNNNFLCHIIRDLFINRSNIVIYGDLYKSSELRSIMANSEHSMGSFILHTERNSQQHIDGIAYWEIGLNAPYMGYNYADLFISVDYNPELSNNNYKFIGEQIRGILRSGGHTFIVNPGKWASCINSYLDLNESLTREAKKYSMFSNEEVFIYENI